MLLIFVIFLADYVLTLREPPDTSELEKLYYEDMVEHGIIIENTLCNISPPQRVSACLKLFQDTHYKYWWKIRINMLAYYHHKEAKCVHRRIRFKTSDTYTQNWHQHMLPCYGQHNIIRSSWNEDDFYWRFFLATGMSVNSFYVFKRERSDVGEEEYVIYDQIGGMKNPQHYDPIQISEIEKSRADFLNTLETKNTNTIEVEAIYVSELIENSKPFKDQFRDLDVDVVLTVCLSIFTTIRYHSQGFLVDREGTIIAAQEQHLSTIIFQHERGYNGHEEITYACRGTHSSRTQMKTMNVREMYYVSSGRRTNSIFVYKMSGFMGSLVPIMYIENFDFDHLKSFQANEMEIYSNFNREVEVIQLDD